MSLRFMCKPLPELPARWPILLWSAWLVGLILLPGCDSVLGGLSEPPRPTIVPVESTPTPRPTEAPPTAAIPSPTLASTLSPTPVNGTVAALAADTPTLPPTDTPVPTAPSSTSTAVPTDPTSPSLQTLNLKLLPLVSGLNRPVYLTNAGDGSGRLFVVEQRGRIIIVKDGAVNPTPFLDIVSLVGSDSLERGLLSVAFQPDYATNGFLFVDYTNKEGNTVIARYHVADNPDQADPNSAKILLTIDQPYPNHNGGQLAFGPDGYLYVGMGDGGSANDPHNNGQSLNTLLGKILRLDINQGDPYGVPANNPFVNQADARPEIWAYGLRNPWRFSFDRATGDMYIADVGQDRYEEVDVALAGTPGGQNFGWRLMEGAHCFDPANCDPASLGVVLPVAEYDHSQGCSITGGYVYRGEQFPALTGTYFYSDWCSGIIWSLRREADGSWSQAELLPSGLQVSSFGQDEAGELYVVNYKGDIFQIGN